MHRNHMKNRIGLHYLNVVSPTESCPRKCGPHGLFCEKCCGNAH
jgi:hypothetical protein